MITTIADPTPMIKALWLPNQLLILEVDPPDEDEELVPPPPPRLGDLS